MKYLFEHPTFNARKVRWLEFLCEFDIEIKHIKGKENKVVNAVSIKVHSMYVASISTRQSYLRKHIVNSIVEDELYVQIKDKFQ